jgi:glycosyltransferase involved in cell wall biosynthesis
MFLELALGFRAAGHAVTVVCRPGSVLAQRVPAGIETCLMPCRSDFDVATLVQLFRLFRRRRYHAVFCNQGRDCVLAGLAALPMRLPVVRVKAMEATRRNPRNWLIYHVLLSAVVSVSGPVQAGLAHLGIPPERLHVIHNGVEITVPSIERAAARARFDVRDTDFAVAYTGRLLREKGVDLLPEIASRLVAAGVPLRLLVAGDGPLRAELEVACAARQLGGHVSLLGFLDEPLSVLLAADAAVMPSRTEAFPVAALEALAMGTPLVACRAGGLVEIVAHEDTALLAAPEDPTALAAALLRLYKDRQLARQLSERGRVRARHFSRERMIEQYKHLVGQLNPKAEAAEP